MIRGLIRQLDRSWRDALAGFMETPDGIAALDRLDTILNVEPVNYHPRGRDILKAFHATPFNKVRVVIIGQDPYPEKEYATGLAFSMPMPDPVPATDDEADLSSSIKGIHCAIKRDLKKAPPKHGNLDHWAKQGVLLLNRVLTLREVPGNKNTHKGKGWEKFTQAVVQALAKSDRPIQFILWGNKAQELKPYIKPHIKGRCYHIHCAPHPHPIAQPLLLERFKDCGHFSAVNVILRASGVKPINWLPQSKCCAILSALFY